MHAAVFGHLTGSLLDYYVRSYVAIIAVPIFFAVSLFLYVDRETAWKRRAKELGFIYAFWLIVTVAAETAGDFSSTFSSAQSVIRFLVGGHTALFFLPILILLCAVASYARKAPSYQNAVLLLITLIIMVFAYPLSVLLRIPVTRLNPLNWLAYPFIATLVWRNRDRKLCLIVVATCTLICVAVETILFSSVPASLLMREDYAFIFGGYCRPSLIFFASLVVLVATHVTYHPYIVVKLSQLSLGIFLVHDIAIRYIMVFSPGISPIPLWAGAATVSALVALILKQRKVRII
jgi:hypothetical protein